MVFTCTSHTFHRVAPSSDCLMSARKDLRVDKESTCMCLSQSLLPTFREKLGFNFFIYSITMKFMKKKSLIPTAMRTEVKSNKNIPWDDLSMGHTSPMLKTFLINVKSIFRNTALP